MLNSFKKILTICFILFFSLASTFAETISVENNDVEVNIESIDDFAITWSEIKSFNQIYILFNSNISTSEDYIRDFSIINKDDIWDELYVENSVIVENEPNKLLLTFDIEAQANWLYELFVITLKDEYWRNIKDWINSITTFQMPNEIIVEEPIQTENIIEEPIDEENVIDEENLEEEVLIEEELVKNEELIDDELLEEGIELNSWEDLWEDFIEKNVLLEANNIEVLPKTWPANLFIFILAAILATLIFIVNFKKS